MIVTTFIINSTSIIFKILILMLILIITINTIDVIATTVKTCLLDERGIAPDYQQTRSNRLIKMGHKPVYTRHLATMSKSTIII